MLVIGIGNPGRRDDGAGAVLVERLRELDIPGVFCDANYQLGIEDALDCSEHDMVVFVDAAVDLGTPFTFTELQPEYKVAVTTHHLPPEAVLALCGELYGRLPRAYVLAIGGSDWDIGEGLCEETERNCRAALDHLLHFLE